MKYPEPKLFTPKNPEKYIGDSKNIVCRSGLEYRFFKFFDTNENISRWFSEEFNVKYISPIDMKEHRYFVDVGFVLKNGKKFIAEIKPASQTQEPKKKRSKHYLTEIATWEINKSKWAAATDFAQKNNMEFIILTEKALPKTLQ